MGKRSTAAYVRILPEAGNRFQVKCGWSGRARTDNLLINSQMQTTDCATDQQTWWEVCISDVSYPTPKVIEPSCRWFLAVDSGAAHNRQFLLPKTWCDYAESNCELNLGKVML